MLEFLKYILIIFIQEKVLSPTKEEISIVSYIIYIGISMISPFLSISTTKICNTKKI